MSPVITPLGKVESLAGVVSIREVEEGIFRIDLAEVGKMQVMLFDNGGAI